MVDVAADNPPLDFYDLEACQWDETLAGWGWPKFRAQQVRDWAYLRMSRDPLAFSNLSKSDRDTLAKRVRFGGGEIVSHQISEDGTQKLLLGWPGAGNAQAETVMIPDGDRRTACVSSQVGCPVGCTFCASGMEGVKGNLTAGQIVEQVMALNQGLSAGSRPALPGERPPTESAGSQAAQRITNVVFMGMGEPLANYANVMRAVRILHEPKGLNIGARRITISTVGVPKRIRDLAGEDLPLNLAISLHAPNETLRRQLIPWAEHFSMSDILDAARFYFEKTGREITFEYILLSDVNDRPEHAQQLVKVCRTLRANVNLLRYNEVPGLPHKRPQAEAVLQFQEILRQGGVNAHVRKSRGRDIAAACGQLRRKENERLVVLGAS
ncbi:MAG TPA: 23S rRNA (adenine(2503)-C(2))-methyltransferase RlmN [Tepidisphaeraceae bacterium]|jgi:23S rRNA (adenine2503-C2)-methyltransferase